MKAPVGLFGLFKIINRVFSFIKDSIYRGSLIISSPSKGIDYLFVKIESHINLYKDYTQLKEENIKLKNNISCLLYTSDAADE